MDYLARIFEQDEIDKLENGFHLRTHGRGGFIYYVANGKVLPIAVETPATSKYDILVFGEPEHLTEYVHPQRTPVSPGEAQDISRTLVSWLEANGYRHDIGQNTD